MSTYTGKYSGSGKNPVPAKGSYLEDGKQDTGDQAQPKREKDFAGGKSAVNTDLHDSAGGMSAPNPSKAWK